MSRIRLASIFGSLSLAIYISVVGVAAMLLGPSPVLSGMTMPLSLLEDLFSVVSDGKAFDGDLLSIFSLWLTFVCVIDLSMIFASLDVRHSVRSLTANSYTKRLLNGFRLSAS